MPSSLRRTMVAAIVLVLPSIAFAQNTYDINFTSNPPTIDGIVSAGEWDDAVGPIGGWRILRIDTGPPDAHNNRFRMMWDETNLYIVSESDYDGWTDNARDQFRGAANSLNMYFDPNLDNEPPMGDPLNGPFLMPDGYQIAVNQYLGSYSCTACSTETNNNPFNALNYGELGSDFSTFAEAHIDGLFGNNSGWLGMRGTVMASVNGASGGVVEACIPWADFDAPGLDAMGLETGLNLDGSIPQAGDTWFFNIAEITTDGNNALPVWNWHNDPAGGNEFFASHPHGLVTFVGGPSGNDFVPTESFMVFRGLQLSAALSDFQESDDVVASFNPGFTVNNSEAPVWLIFDAVAAGATDFLIESNAGTPGLSYTVEAFNWAIADFDVISVEDETFNTDSVNTFAIVAADHIDSGGEVRARVGWRQTGFTINFPWVVNVDQVGWEQ